jgi:hypothetical protein
MKASGSPVHAEQISSVIGAMDKNYLLSNKRYEEHIRSIKEEYGSRPCRESFLSGKSYPTEEKELRTFLAEMLKEERQTGGGSVQGLIVPHIDYSRGAAVYKEIYKYLPDADDLLIVILGTCHRMTPHMWNISLKDFATPLGVAKNVRELGAVIRQDVSLKDCVEEWSHRNEHSIELQLPIIQFLLKERNFQILPILTGSLHECIVDGKSLDEDGLPELIAGLRRLLKKHNGPTLLIAAADLAHIGSQFGDSYRLDSVTLGESSRKDKELLTRITEVDARGFFEEVKREGDRRRICGLAPIYFLLSLLAGSRGEMVRYDQWTDGASSVSFAGLVFYK